MPTSFQRGVRAPGFFFLCAAYFMTAFVDNAFRIGVGVLAVKHAAHLGAGWTAAGVISLSTILFLLPYAVLSLFAGAVADRFSKRRVFIWGKLAELPLALVGLWGLYNANAAANAGASPLSGIVLVLAMLFFLGVQASFLSPARYGILPEILTDEELGAGNGYLELCTFAGVFFGTISAGAIVDGLDPGHALAWAFWLIPAASIAGLAFAFLIPRVPPVNPATDLAASIHPRRLRENFAALRSVPGLLPAVAGTVLFWSMGTLTTLNGLNVAQATLGLGDRATDANSVAIATSIGLGLGCLAAGRLSRGGIELGLIPSGAAMWTVAFAALAGVGLLGTDAAGHESWWATHLLMAAAGFAAGWFVVPLNAFIEHHSPADRRASMIATGNILQVLGMIAVSVANALVCMAFTRTAAGENGAAVVTLLPAAVKVLWLGAAALLACCSWYVIRKLPDCLFRFVVFLMVNVIYRLKVRGLENIPKDSGALLVLNHVSFMDGVIVLSAVPRRTRFIVYKSHFDNRWLNWMGRLNGAIPIDSEGPPREIVAALRTASDALANGELVCIFAEGGISRTGVMLPFQRGFETILKRAGGVPIVPGYIDGMWESIFSFRGGKFFRKWPSRLPLPVNVRFGAPLPSHTPAFAVRQEVQKLSARSFMDRKERQYPLAWLFLRSAWRRGRADAVADETRTLKYGELLKAAVAVSGVLRRQLGPEQNVAILLPPSVGAVVVNLAVLLLKRTPVNLNYTIGAEALNACLRQAGAKQAISSRAFEEKTKLKPAAAILYADDFKALIGTADKLRAAACWLLPPWFAARFVLGLRRDMDGLATLIFSSGSTGDPKGVMLTHHNIVSNIESAVQHFDFDQRIVVMGVLPFFHSFGFTLTLWMPLYLGAQAAYHYSPLEVDAVAKLIRTRKATLFASTATFLRMHLRKNAKEDFASLDYLICGAEKLPVALAEEFERKMGILPVEGYGCTELSPVVSANRRDYVDGSYRQVCGKLGTIGHPFAGMAVEVRDAETGAILPPGAEGDLWVLGANVMKGYLDRPDLTAEAVVQGWYRTGDVAKLDEDGFITITDRASRFSKIGGEMVPHGKVEEALHEALATTERVFVVVGLPDERKGERLAVLHTPLPRPAEELWAAVKDKLPPLWLPARTAFQEVPALPVLGTGKLDLKGCKALAAAKPGA